MDEKQKDIACPECGKPIPEDHVGLVCADPQSGRMARRDWSPERRANAISLDDIGEVDIIREIHMEIAQQIREAVLAEREACIAVIDAYRNGPKEFCSDGCLESAQKDIRSRPAP